MVQGTIVGEHIFSPSALRPTSNELPLRVRLLSFASLECGATAFSTGLAMFEPSSYMHCHRHEFSEAITVLEGQAQVQIEDRIYRLEPRDCVHIPADVPHVTSNVNSQEKLIVHLAFSSPRPRRELISAQIPLQDYGLGAPPATAPETIVRAKESPVYELASNAFFNDLFARRLGAVGICGGYGRFLPGASLPCHIHDYDESITIVEGSAICLVEGRQYALSGYDTAFVPKHTPHRFLNQSTDEMAMVWVYAGDEPDRKIVDTGYCSGSLVWSQR